MLASVASLFVVLALLAGLLWWLRRLTPQARGGRHLRVVESVTLGPGQALHLVRLGARGLVVATSRERCELVAELDELHALPEQAPPEEAPARAGWRDAIGQAWGRR